MNAQTSAAAALPTRTQVAVVGAGPVGLIAAIELARHGLQPVVLDAKDGIAWSSRATCISRRSLEILDRIGAGPAFAAKALPWSQGRTFHRDRLVFRLDMPHCTDDRHAPFVNLQQFYTEQFLLDRLRALGGDVRWRHRITGITTDPGSATLALATPEGDRSLRADWVVAADGGRSTLREQMGLDLHGTAYESRYLIADIEVEGVDRPVERNVWFDPPSNPGSTVILHVQPDRIWRIDYQLRDEEDAEAALREENVRARLQAQLDMMGITAPWRLVWRSLYKALALSLESYRHERVLFAGDAAHLVPIFGVRGLNSGIDDAHNLGWKLAMVALNEAPAALLDSYHHERRRATRENHAQAIKSTWFMSPPSAGFRIMRDAVLCLAAEHPWASTLINPRQSAAHVYDDSPVIQPDARPFAAGIAPGAPVPNLRLPTGDRHLHDMMAPLGFTLLVFLDRLGPAADTLPALADMNLHIVRIGAGQEADVIDGQGRLAERFAADTYAAYLVRPDQHVAARFAQLEPSAVAAALDIALARTQASPPAGVAAVEQPVLVPPPNNPGAVALGQEGLEHVFAAVSHGIDAAGGAVSAPFLARLALLLAEAVGDADRVLAAVNAARGKPA
jgi:3-(3-hydroxy-phenyl)propionate hydroxylase